MKRIIFALGLTLLLALAFTITALAGGWAVITLDELPGEVAANQPLEIGFMVRQHGVTPLEGQSPVITAKLAGSSEAVIVRASEEGEVGHYAATLTLPQAGEWLWNIEAFGAPQPMPALTVVDSAWAATKSEPITSNSNFLSLLTGGIGLIGVIGGLLALQRKVRWAAAFVVAGLLVSGAGFVSAADQPKAELEAKEPVAASIPSQVELGHDLFIAKGCMVCHSHSETNRIREFGVDMGPDLTNFTASPEYLRLWLKVPSAAKSTAQMPTLGLSDAEIEALIAFINND
jgi:cytochrome c2